MSSFVLYLSVFVYLMVIQVCARLDTLSTVEDYMNICLDGHNHKAKPGPEDALMNFCTPWAQKSCCTPETAKGLHINPKWLNFDWNHCQQLSPQCREYFIMDLCFYECSPNVGPWLVKDSKKFRKERFINVPLCQTECNRWWKACESDFTCIKNWAVGFNWSSGINTCPENTKCQKFNEIYNNATDFCENLMGGSFKVTSDNEDCFFLWFDPNYSNPNEKVALKKAYEILGLSYVDSENLNGIGSRSRSNLLLLLLTMMFFLKE